VSSDTLGEFSAGNNGLASPKAQRKAKMSDVRILKPRKCLRSGVEIAISV
jgi:hypothetical protein